MPHYYFRLRLHCPLFFFAIISPFLLYFAAPCHELTFHYAWLFTLFSWWYFFTTLSRYYCFSRHVTIIDATTFMIDITPYYTPPIDSQLILTLPLTFSLSFHCYHVTTTNACHQYISLLHYAIAIPETPPLSGRHLLLFSVITNIFTCYFITSFSSRPPPPFPPSRQPLFSTSSPLLFSLLISWDTTIASFHTV